MYLIRISEQNDPMSEQVIFKAPDNSIVAKGIWMYLVENLRYGLEVELDGGMFELKRPSGVKIPADVYREIMALRAR